MNLIEKKEKENRINELKNSKSKKLAELEATSSLEEGKSIDNELEGINLEIIKLENELTESEKGDKKPMNNYIGSKKEVKDFVESLKNAPTKEVASQNWAKKLSNNGVEITDTDNYLPKKIVEAITTSLTESNPVFPLFRITNVGAMLISQEFDSDDEAQVHEVGTTKKEQEATLKLSSIQPAMIYKLQSIHELVRRTLGSIDDIVDLIIAELTQRIVDKIVDLALVEGDETNGFRAIQTDKNVKRVKEIATPDSFVDGVEEAVDFVRQSSGLNYLIVTTEQRKQLLKELRDLNKNVRIKNDDAEIASEVGVDGIVVYRGTKTLKPIVLVKDAYHVDMDEMTQIRAFKWETNENKFLVEVVAAGHVDKMYGAAYLTLTTPK
ncbi:MAG: hypothetical protein ACRCZN_01975 [Lactococcus lactis]